MVTVENRQKIYDTLLVLNDGGLITASAAGLVSAAAKVIDIGAGFIQGNMVVDVAAIEVDTGDELYTLALQGSNTAAFGGTDIVELAILKMGDAAVLPGAADQIGPRYVIPFSNLHGTLTYKYVRTYMTITGTIVTGINQVTFLTQLP